MRTAVRILAVLALAVAVSGAVADDQRPVKRLNTTAESNTEQRIVHFRVMLEDSEEGFVDLPEPVEPPPVINGVPFETPPSRLIDGNKFDGTIGGAIPLTGGGPSGFSDPNKTERSLKTLIRKLG